MTHAHPEGQAGAMAVAAAAWLVAGAFWATVAGLGDRDTTCAIVGGIVALFSPVPGEWLASREPLPRLQLP